MTLAWLIFGVLVVVVAIPYVFIKHLGWGVLRCGSADEATIGLTFDDGPHLDATPRVLDVLARHGVHATFFIVGENADAHPELVQRILTEGHEIGSHSYHHRHALFHRLPLTGFFDTRRGIRRLEALLGRRTQYFRPPWGAYSWTVLLGIWSARLRPVHWTVESHDWHPRFSPPDVVRKVLAEAHAGAIIVMHDAGRGAAKTVHALEAIITGLAARGLRPVPLSQMALRTGFPLPEWRREATLERDIP